MAHMIAQGGANVPRVLVFSVPQSRYFLPTKMPLPRSFTLVSISPSDVPRSLAAMKQTDLSSFGKRHVHTQVSLRKPLRCGLNILLCSCLLFGAAQCRAQETQDVAAAQPRTVMNLRRCTGIPLLREHAWNPGSLARRRRDGQDGAPKGLVSRIRLARASVQRRGPASAK